MSCRLTSRIVSGVAVVDLSGKLRFLEFGLRDEIQKLLAQGHREFVLNLTDVSYIDSFGLGQLISNWTSIQRVGGSMTLLRPTPEVRKLFAITKLDTVFTIGDEQHYISGQGQIVTISA